MSVRYSPPPVRITASHTTRGPDGTPIPVTITPPADPAAPDTPPAAPADPAAPDTPPAAPATDKTTRKGNKNKGNSPKDEK